MEAKLFLAAAMISMISGLAAQFCLQEITLEKTYDKGNDPEIMIKCNSGFYHALADVNKPNIPYGFKPPLCLGVLGDVCAIVEYDGVDAPDEDMGTIKMDGRMGGRNPGKTMYRLKSGFECNGCKESGTVPPGAIPDLVV